ncbi:MAG: hypothetical protein LBE22_09235 [Azoarcus sp.]|nr:hypothetical protein [Azoarcus sp.]
MSDIDDKETKNKKTIAKLCSFSAAILLISGFIQNAIILHGENAGTFDATLFVFGGLFAVAGIPQWIVFWIKTKKSSQALTVLCGIGLNIIIIFIAFNILIPYAQFSVERLFGGGGYWN